MESEIEMKENCISQYNNTLADKELIKVINNPCESKRAFIELHRESCVSFGVYRCEL